MIDSNQSNASTANNEVSIWKRLRRGAKQGLPPKALKLLKRIDLLFDIARKRTFDDAVPFNNEIDRMLAVDPLWNHTASKDKALLGAIAHCGTRAAMSSQEMLNLCRFVDFTEHLSGAIAEVGVFRGGSAKLIAHANRGRRPIHLFDTFSGIPEVTPGLDTIKLHALAVGLEPVQQFLENSLGSFHYHVGYFPETADALPADMSFSLVNLDMDTYLSTKNGFEYFYPRLQSQGVIICHDYFSNSCPGVKLAVDEFIADKPERVIGLWHSQVALIKS
jgi:O-methyltransferase